MKINELIKTFEIHTSNEEKKLLDKISGPCYVNTLTEREQQVAENLVRKSLLSRVNYKGSVVVLPNEKS
tara:strand:- start:831 stop:1037 length:207 start_codon:yes stop_codon:yes gene_type:complete